MDRLDCAVIGAGPAGLSAAVNLKIRGKSFRLFGKKALSEKIRLAPKVENYLGLPGITGVELSSRMKDHIDIMGIGITEKQVTLVYGMGGYFSLAAQDETFEAATVILATGTSAGKQYKNEPELLGRGVSYCATCDAPLYRGKTVGVVALSGDAAHEAEFLAGIAAKVLYIMPDKKHPAPKPAGNIEIIEDVPLEILGDKKITGVELKDGRLDLDGLFIIRDSVAPSSLVPGLELDNGYVKIDAHTRTNLPGLFAAGDCTGKPHQYIRAAGQGQTAALNAVDYLASLKK